MADITFISSTTSTLTTAATTFNMGIPAGVAAGDFLLLEVTLFLNSVDTSISVPVGWNNLSSIANGTSIRQGLLWKLAVGGETTVTVTFGAAKTATGAVSRWTGVDTLGSFAPGPGTASNNTTPTSPSLTIQLPGVVYCHFVGRNSNTVTTTLASGFTLGYNISNASNAVQSHMEYKNFGATTGASGTVVSTASGGANYVVQGLLLYSTNFARLRNLTQSPVSSSVNTASVAKPGAVAVNDILIAQIYRENSALPTTVPTGWTLKIQANQTLVAGKNFWAFIYWKRDDGTAGPYVWSWAATAWTELAIFAYYGGSTTGDPFDGPGASQVDSVSDTTIAAPSVTPTFTNVLLLTFFWSFDLCDYSVPTNMFERYDPAGQDMAEDDQGITLGGVATGTRTSTTTVASAQVGVSLLLRSTASVVAGVYPRDLIQRQLFPLIVR